METIMHIDKVVNISHSDTGSDISILKNKIKLHKKYQDHWKEADYLLKYYTILIVNLLHYIITMLLN